MLFENVNFLNENFDVENTKYILVEDEKISYIGNAKPDNYNDDRFDCRNYFMLPAFYNTHCHVPMTLLRGYGEDLPLQRWLYEKIFPFEAKLTARDCYYGALLGIMELLAGGCASFSDMYFYILDIARAVEDAGIKANICHGLSSFDENEDLYNLKGYKDTLELMRLSKNTGGRIIADAGLHAEYTSTERLVRQIAEFAVSNNLIVHTHISENTKEHEECKAKRNGRTPVKYFADCGLFDRPVQAAHCVFVEDEDLDIIKASNSTISHCISSNLKLGSGIAPIAKYSELGMNITIATDGASSNNNLNMFEEMHIAALVAKGYSNNAEVLPVDETLRMITRNGALAQGRNDCGSIKVGNKADIILLKLDQPHMTPQLDIRANIVYSAQASDVYMTMVDGKILYKDKEFLTIDAQKVKYEVHNRINRILSEI